MNDTRAACTPGKNGNLSYALPGGSVLVYSNFNEVVETQIANNVLYEFDTKHQYSVTTKENPMYQTQYNVIDGDCLEAAEAMRAQGLNPVVLNMASNSHVGGGYLNGAAAQEENLFRRTNLMRVLADESRWYKPTVNDNPSPHSFYPLPLISAVYSPSVFVLRGSEAKRYPWLKDPYTLAIISSAAPRSPRLVPGSASRMVPEAESIWIDKISAVLWTAANEGHDSIVLSAWGCGAYANPPEHVAELFKQVLEQEWIRGFFRNVTFAIFDDANAYQRHNPKGNLFPFQKEFAPDDLISVTRNQDPTASSSSASAKKPAQIPGSIKVWKSKRDRNASGSK
jgi:uncharacterized protein (TIGR02452 family)